MHSMHVLTRDLQLLSGTHLFNYFGKEKRSLAEAAAMCRLEVLLTVEGVYMH